MKCILNIPAHLKNVSVVCLKWRTSVLSKSRVLWANVLKSLQLLHLFPCCSAVMVVVEHASCSKRLILQGKKKKKKIPGEVLHSFCLLLGQQDTWAPERVRGGPVPGGSPVLSQSQLWFLRMLLARGRWHCPCRGSGTSSATSPPAPPHACYHFKSAFEGR